MDESALLRLVHAPETAVSQLRHLVELGEGINRITLQMLPLSASLHASIGEEGRWPRRSWRARILGP
ncbi:Scr1 family TA system antitoxin-like transcriptional regulator [Nocardiopsis sp. FR6]|uniref:Scr1 family TA system antitoxin-like transcriptional regulator n=1 Tax=Nocardiopsis sp. FR6 TaxID=2605986 RepID=UPI0037423794